MRLQITNPYLQLPSLCYDRVDPKPLKNPYLIHTNREVAKTLGIDEESLKSSEFIKFINGDLPNLPNKIPRVPHNIGILSKKNHNSVNTKL